MKLVILIKKFFNMEKNLLHKINSKFKNYKLFKIESGSSKRLYYRIKDENNSFILMDSSQENQEYINFLKVYSILSNINISIPKIVERNDNESILILEDLGNLRFDKILKKYSLKKLLEPAVKTLVIFNKEIKFNSSIKLNKYSFETLKLEVGELIEFYYPHIYKKKISNDLKLEFYNCWEKIFNNLELDFQNFVHKDFNINNLIFLPDRKDQKRCGVLDFQSAFWGDNCWDLFSLLEDSRIYFNDSHNEDLVNFFYENINQNISFNDFKKKYNILNCSRQTRLLGRWIKLNMLLQEDCYLEFIKVTKRRLINSLNHDYMSNLKNFYYKIFPNLND